MSIVGRAIKQHKIQSKIYTINPKHRGNVPQENCTQWVCTEADEVTFFSNSLDSNFLSKNDSYWWVVDKDHCSHIGITNINNAYIAKFVCDNNNFWHGYPVTGMRKGDIPSDDIIAMWHSSNIIKKKYLDNLKRGRGYV